MKTTGFSILLIWFAIFAYAANTFAQDSPQWHLPEGATARLGKGWITEIAYSPDGTRLAVAGSIGIWLYDAQTDEALDLLTGHTSWVSSVSFSPDGNTLASGSDDGTVRLWDANTGSPLRTLTGHTFEVLGVSFSPDGNTLASGSWGEIRLWDATTDSPLHTLTTGHPAPIPDVSFSPDGNMLASASRDKTVRLWDANTGSLLRTLTGHTDWVESVSFSPDGNTLASGSSDGTVLLWELAPAPVASEKIAADVNTDGVVNIQDMVLVASNFGKTGENVADVNTDGVVNIIDLTLVAGMLGNAAGAPSVWGLDRELAPTREQVQQWLHQARQVNLTDSAFQRGILVLEHLLVTLTPKQTALLPNYPNPFNPETWIPYQLAAPTDVTVSIYSADGRLVQILALGHQPVGLYESRSRAAYWDGRNALGESVASGVYFYTLTAGDFTATRKMLIMK